MSSLLGAGFVVLVLVLLGAVGLLLRRGRKIAATAFGVALLLLASALAYAWLSFGYRNSFLPIEAIFSPDRAFTLDGTAIPLPPQTVQTGGCSSTGRWFYSRSSLTRVAEFYRSVGATVAPGDQAQKVTITYKEVRFEAAATSAGETVLGIGCAVHTSWQGPSL